MKLHASEGAALPRIPVARAQGVWLRDHGGRCHLNAISSWWVNLFGHNHPAIRTALIDQLHTLDHVMLAGFSHGPRLCGNATGTPVLPIPCFTRCS